MLVKMKFERRGTSRHCHSMDCADVVWNDRLKEQLDKLKRNQERRLHRKNAKLGIPIGAMGVGGKRASKTETVRCSPSRPVCSADVCADSGLFELWNSRTYEDVEEALQTIRRIQRSSTGRTIERAAYCVRCWTRSPRHRRTRRRRSGRSQTHTQVQDALRRSTATSTACSSRSQRRLAVNRPQSSHFVSVLSFSVAYF